MARFQGQAPVPALCYPAAPFPFLADRLTEVLDSNTRKLQAQEETILYQYPQLFFIGNLCQCMVTL